MRRDLAVTAAPLLTVLLACAILVQRPAQAADLESLAKRVQELSELQGEGRGIRGRLEELWDDIASDRK